MIRITFNPDEVTDVNERATPIPIIDDLVNEADEQVFIVQLHLVNSINPGAIDLTTRAASICRIIDDDSKSNYYKLSRSHINFLYDIISMLQLSELDLRWLNTHTLNQRLIQQ